MRLALLTDLHANRQALDACLAHAAAHGPDQFAFTGDFVGYGADPGYVLDTVMAHVARGAIVVQGNHDMAATRDARPQMHAEARESLEWTRAQLLPEHVEFLATLPLTQTLGDMMFVHASACEPAKWEYVTGLDEAERSLSASGHGMVFSGHVHAPALYRRSEDGAMAAAVPMPGLAVRLPPQHQYLVIPGSAGQPRDNNNAACYALYDDSTRELTYFRVPYDNGAAARRVIAVGLPLVFAMRLIEGI
jgi:diadenosine tetraphosphatase ApaH/serine/threonine PP2A family protein phosphatase